MLMPVLVGDCSVVDLWFYLQACFDPLRIAHARTNMAGLNHNIKSAEKVVRFYPAYGTRFKMRIFLPVAERTLSVLDDETDESTRGLSDEH
jgi:hypothetical protein